MAQITDFGKAINHRLIDLDQQQDWLIEQIRQKTGLYCDSSYLSKIKRGKNSPQKIIAAICEILEIPEESA